MNKSVVLIVLAIMLADIPYRAHPQRVSAGKPVNDLPPAIKKIKDNMVFVNGGTFIMGCLSASDTDCHDNELPAHKVTVSSFYINKYDVTVRDFELFISETGYKTDADKQGFSSVYSGEAFVKKYGVNWRCNANGYICSEKEKDNPVVHVSWNDAQQFCRWLSSKTGNKFRLATEAEWEFAAKGGNKSCGYKYAGGDDIDKVAFYNANCGDSSLNAVGLKQPNELGLYDMSGNVWQLVNDWFDKTYFANSPEDNPKGAATGTTIIARGGSWRRDPARCRVTSRHYEPTDARHSNLGFRVAADL